ncbi:hypothetical protein EST38_g11063 [Candolleomyces aberdarensis]|uniref:Uncharacterized protein n=1 Tax=Candolleomyces aberdarensis TaxID=2316362 RepID=A0A4Q2D5T8_9AGAR|nr:hypothetical protein EST38_g11063 [Candolleomyces aberdarensis]
MSSIQRAISELRTLLESATVSIQTVQKHGSDSDEGQAAQLSEDNSKLISAPPNGEWNQKFTIELIPDTFKLKISIVLEDGTTVYVTSKDASAGDYLLVSGEPTIYGVGANESGLTISTEGKDGVELYWTWITGFPGPQIVLQTWEDFKKSNQAWKFVKDTTD